MSTKKKEKWEIYWDGEAPWVERERRVSACAFTCSCVCASALCVQACALSSRFIKITDRSTGSLACPFARSLAPLACSLAPHYSPCLRAPLRSLVCSLAHFAHSLARGKEDDWMAIFSVFFSFLDHSARAPSVFKRVFARASGGGSDQTSAFDTATLTLRPFTFQLMTFGLMTFYPLFL